MLKDRIYHLLKKSEKYTKTDMLYLTKGGFWLVLGHTISSASALIIAIAFANLIPKEVYGTYKYVLSILAILTVTTLPGINGALSQAVARGYEGSFLSGLKNKMRWGILGTLGGLALSLYYFINDNNLLSLSFLVGSLFIPFIETFNLYGAYLEGRKRFKNSVSYFSTIKVLLLVILVTTLLLTDDLIIILATYLLSWTLLQLGVLLLVLKKFPPNKNKEEKLISYGKHLSAIDAIGRVSLYLDNLLLFHYLGPVQVAIYTFAFAPIEQVRAVYKSIPILALPKLSNRTFHEINTLLLRRLALLFLVGGIMTIGYIILAPFFFQLVFPQYLESVIYSQLLAVLFIFHLPLILLLTALHSKLNITPKPWLYWKLVPRILFIAALLIFTPLYGIIGVIVSRFIFVISSLITTAIQWILLTRRGDVPDVPTATS